MKVLDIKGMKTNQKAYQLDSGWCVRVDMEPGAPTKDDEVRIACVPTLIDTAGKEQKDSAGDTIVGRRVERAIMVSAFETCQCSLADSFWKRWVEHAAPNDRANAPFLPADIQPGDTRTVAGETMHSGMGAPADDMGAVGDWYADLSGSGFVYKKRVGELEYFARLAAAEFGRRMAVSAALEKAGLSPTPDVVTAQPAQGQ